MKDPKELQAFHEQQSISVEVQEEEQLVGQAEVEAALLQNMQPQVEEAALADMTQKQINEQKTREVIEKATKQIPQLTFQETTDAKKWVIPIERSILPAEPPQQYQPPASRSFKEKWKDYWHRSEAKKHTPQGMGSEVSYDIRQGLLRYQQDREGWLPGENADPAEWSLSLRKTFQHTMIDGDYDKGGAMTFLEGEVALEHIVDEVLFLSFDKNEFSVRNLRQNADKIKEKAEKLRSFLENPLMTNYLQKSRTLSKEKRNQLKVKENLFRTYITSADQVFLKYCVDSKTGQYAQDAEKIRQASNDASLDISAYREQLAQVSGWNEAVDIRNTIEEEQPAAKELVKQLQERKQQKKNGIWEYEDRLREIGDTNMTDFVEIVNQLAEGHQVNEQGEPSSEYQARKKERDIQMIENLLSGDENRFYAELEKQIQSLLSFQFTNDILSEIHVDDVAFLRDAADWKAICEKNTSILKLLQQTESGRKYYQNMDEAKKKQLIRRSKIVAAFEDLLANEYLFKGVKLHEAQYVTTNRDYYITPYHYFESNLYRYQQALFEERKYRGK